MVNEFADEGKEFIVFKRQLYQMYEVQNRTKEEHDAFSIGIERKNLNWLYQANLEFVREMTRINHLDNLVAHGHLKGSIFRARKFNVRILKGVSCLGGSVLGYMNLAQLSLILGPNVATLGLIATAAYGTSMFRESNSVSQIDYIAEGENRGKLRIKIQNSLISSKWIVASANEVSSILNLTGSDFSSDTSAGNVITVGEYLDESTGEMCQGGTFTIPADGVSDQTSLEWVLSSKSQMTPALRSFNDVVMQRHLQIASTGGITGLAALTAAQTGWSNINTEDEVNTLIDDPSRATKLLEQMKNVYGKDSLEKMKPKELYKAYKDFILAKSD